MILGAFDLVLDGTPPVWLRKLEAKVLMRTFAQAFDVEPPSLDNMTADEALATFRIFTAACMEAARSDKHTEAIYRARLRTHALTLGRKIRMATPIHPASAFSLIRYLYRGIGINLEAESSENMRFKSCSFAQTYTPADCWMMSAFDEGIMCGILGIAPTLRFEYRLTEGAACCRAHFEQEKTCHEQS